MMPRKWLPDNVTAYKDRHGKTRYRFRQRGLPAYGFKHPPGTPEFMAELHAARTAGAVETDPHFAPYTYDALIVSFYRSSRWTDMRDSSQRTYRGIIERFRAKNGGKDARYVATATIDAKLVAMVATPAAANNLRKALARLHRHAIKLGWRTDNPVAATDPYRKGKGWHCWTEAEIAAFDAQWPVGSRQRLAKELLLCTALRMSDMLKVGRQHRKRGKLHLHHEKNDSDTVIPILPELAQALDATDNGHMTYLVTQFGKPFTPTGFGNWFRRACKASGIAHCTPHGLRKAMSRRLAESGATPLQGRSITGHKTDREFAHYAEAADREVMAEQAMANLTKMRLANRKTNDG